MVKAKESEALLSLLNNPPREAPSLKVLARHARVSDKTISRMLKENNLGEFRVCLNYPLLRIFTVLVYCESKNPVPEEDFKNLSFVEEVYVPDSFKNEYFIKAKVLGYGNIFKVLKNFRDSLDMDYFVTNIAYEYEYDNLMPQDNKYLDIERATLDEKDWRILASLNDNAMKTFAVVSRETGIPVQTVSYRVNRMKEQNIILGYPLMPNLDTVRRAGLRMYVYQARRWDPIDFGEEVINVSMHKFHAGYNMEGVALAKSSTFIRKGLRGSDKAKVFRIRDVIQGNWIEGVLNEGIKRG